MADEEIDQAQLIKKIDDLIDRIREVSTNNAQGELISAVGVILGEDATSLVDLVRRCNAVAEMAATVYAENNAPTGH
jgi:hypothetical protein